MRSRSLLISSLMILVALTGEVVAADKSSKTPAEILKEFADSWKDSDWQPKNFRGGYMRPLDDAGWKARMLALQQLVQHGKIAVPTLTKTLKTGSAPERILAAQALGYLAPHAPLEAMQAAAKNDRDTAVRLYAVDSLGMQGKPAAKVNWDMLTQRERSRDVRSHVGYAKERKAAAVKKSVVDTLTQWDPKTLDSAVVGKPAPAFTLQSADGKTVSLKDYRGKKAVVLVFIYGDT